MRVVEGIFSKHENLALRGQFPERSGSKPHLLQLWKMLADHIDALSCDGHFMKVCVWP
jgi:hypothetical protein